MPRDVTPSSGSLGALLRSRRRAQKPVSCEPCRERKVRCDKGHPCTTCARRGYPDLCVYPATRTGSRGSEGGRRRIQGGRPNARPPSPASDRDVASADTPIPRAGPEPQYTPASLAAGGGIIDSELPNSTSTVALSQGASPLHRDTADHHTAFGLAILPLLGAGEAGGASETDGAWRGTLALLSSEGGVLEVFQAYRRQVHPFHAIPVDLEEVERRFCLLLNLQDGGTKGGGGPVRDPNWLCLLNAVLAAGAQASEMALERRISMSRLHTRLAFQGLHATDYLSRPYNEAIQALLLLGIVLQNDMVPQAAWALGGSTMRLAQCLGIQKRSRAGPASATAKDSARLRLAIVWQDSLLSLAFGRLSACHEMDFEDDLPDIRRAEAAGGLQYREAMNWLCHIATRHLSARPAATQSPGPLPTCRDMNSLDASLSPHLRNRQSCMTIQDIQEHYAFELHRNFSVSTICRPHAAAGKSQWTNVGDGHQILSRLTQALERSARAYLHLRSVSSYASRSWAFIHNGLASVLLLSLMKETRESNETKLLQSRIIHSLEQERASGSDSGPAHASRLSDTHEKALKAIKALRRLSEHESTDAVRARSVAATRMDESTPSYTTQGPEAPSFQVPDLTFIPPEAWEAEEWLSAFDFDQSPIGAFESIMADPSTGYQNLNTNTY